MCRPSLLTSVCARHIVHVYMARSGSVHGCQYLCAFISGIWRLSRAPAGKGSASSSAGRAARWLKAQGKDFGEMRQLASEVTLSSVLERVQPQSTGGGKAPGGSGILGDPTGPAYPQDLLTGSGHGGGAWALSTGAGQRAWG